MYEHLPVGLLTWWGAPEESTTIFPTRGLLLPDEPWRGAEDPAQVSPMVQQITHGGSTVIYPGGSQGRPNVGVGKPLPGRGGA